LWFFCFQFFVAEQIARLGWPGHYSMMRNWVSDLGATYSSTFWIMDGSFVVQGLLMFFGAILVRRFFPARWPYWVVLFLFAVSGVGVLVVGLVPEDGNLQVHGLAALVHLLAGNLAMVGLGLLTMCRPFTVRSRSFITFAAGSVGLLALLILGMRKNPAFAALGLNVGTIERFSAYPLPLWLSWTGYRMLTVRGRKPAAVAE
jgi:hypothetical membrane protein